MDKSNLFHIYYNSTCTMMEFHNVHMKIFNLEGGGCGWGGSARIGRHLQVILPEVHVHVIVVHKCAQLMSVPTHFKPHTLWLISPFRVGEKVSVYLGHDVITSDRRMKGLCNLLDGTRGILFDLSHSKRHQRSLICFVRGCGGHGG